MKTIHTYWRETILGVSMLLFSIYFTVVSFLRYTNFYAGKFDLGNMSHTVWNTLHGNFFALTDPNGTETVSRLATHADFILILLTPFYALWTDPRMLLLIQVIVIALGAIFVYLLGNEIIKNKNISLFFAVLYLLNPSIQRTIMYDFHAVVLATTFLLGAFYFMIKKQYGWFLLFSLLAAITKEQVWLTVALFGVYLFWFEKKHILGSVVFLFCIGMFYYLFTFAIPEAAKQQHFALQFYAEYGESPVEIAKNIISSPFDSLITAFAPDRLTYMWKLFSPFLLLSLIAPQFMLFMAPEFFLYLLSSNPNFHQIYYQYTATLTPFIIISAIYGFAWAYTKDKFFRDRNVLVGLALLSTFFSHLYSPLPFSKEPNLAMFTKQQPHKEEINRYIETIPVEKSVAASNSIGSHLTNRKNLYTIPIGTQSADLLVFMLNDATAYPSAMAHREMKDDILKTGKYILDYEIGDFVVLKRK